MRHADLRARLLLAAEQEIIANGLARTSLRGIARRVGVSHQATAHHFDDRAGLFTALAIEGFEKLLSETKAAMEAVPELGGKRAAAAGRVYLDFARANPMLFDLMFRPELLHAEDERLAVVRQAHRELMVDTIAAARRSLSDTAIGVDELATLGWATVHGLAVLERDRQLTHAAPDVDVDQLLTTLGATLDSLS